MATGNLKPCWHTTSINTNLMRVIALLLKYRTKKKQQQSLLTNTLHLPDLSGFFVAANLLNLVKGASSAQFEYE